MKNPLKKRLPREFIGDFGKYLVIFLFMIGTIGFVSGFLVADDSMLKAYDESFEKYNIEDGKFETAEELDESTIDVLEQEDVKIYTNYYVEEDTDCDRDGDIDSTIRIFPERKDVDLVCLMKGEWPEKANEIAIDRMYADNNKVKVGDTIETSGKELKVTGLVALSDYSALFSDNGDMMFDAVKFSVAIMTKEGFETFGDVHLHYSYAWTYNEKPEDDIEAKKMAEDFMKVLAQNTQIQNFVPAYLNQAIHFTGDDMGSDKSMMIVLLYILIAIMAFVFAITTSNTITKEAAVIGTLRASGYSRGELLSHYISIPVLVTLIAAVIGNILGYTVFKEICAGMYYGSYSLPTYETRWNAEAFLLTTIVPLVIMILINVVIIYRKLTLSPLKFLRKDLKRSSNKKAVKLPAFPFFQRFRLRIILQNMPAYLTLFIGIIFANILLLFGMMMSPLLSHYQDEIVDNMIASYQYVLKTPVETETDKAETYCVTSLKTEDREYASEEISVYGINKDSAYISEEMPDDGVYISDGYAETYRLSKGDTITLKESYGDKQYDFKIKGMYNYPAGLAMFMDIMQYREVFDKDAGYYNGYFSNTEITDIDEKMIASFITEEDLTKVSRQLNVSMGNMFYLINVFAVILSALLIYLLTKLVIEKNASSISMVKILGYEDREISSLYLMATTWVVVVSLVISIVVSRIFMGLIYHEIMKEFTGWLSLYIPPQIYVEMFIGGLIIYLLVAVIQMRRIKKVPMDQALKDVE